MANQLRAHLQITLPRCDRTVPRHRLRDHAAVPDPLPLPGQGRLAISQATGELADQRRLQRPRQPRRPARPPRRRPARHHRPPSRSPGPDHPALSLGHPDQPAHPDQSPRADRRPARRPPRRRIFTSLPRSGTVRAARLLAEIGDCRGRFPTPEALACLAGAAPSTRQSGKVKVVAFRWAVDKQLRGAVIDFAGDSHHANPWAADLYRRAIAAATTTPTPSASSPAPGSTSSGAAGKTASPTTPPNTAPYNAPPTRS